MKKTLSLLSILAVLVFFTPIKAHALTNLFSTSLVKSSTQYWSHTHTSTLEPTGAITVSAWFNLSSIPVNAGAAYTILGDDFGGGNTGYWLFTQQQSGSTQVGFLVGNNTTNGETSPRNIVLNTGTWYNAVGVYNGTTGTAYVNGVSLGTFTLAGPIVYTGTGPFSIGYSLAGPFDPFDGQIDDTRVWGRALSSTEVSNLYSSPCTFSNGANLLGWWQFENNGNDSSGNALTLTNNNSATFTSSVPYTCTIAPGFNFWQMTDF